MSVYITIYDYLNYFRIKFYAKFNNYKIFFKFMSLNSFNSYFEFYWILNYLYNNLFYEGLSDSIFYSKKLIKHSYISSVGIFWLSFLAPKLKIF